MTDQVLWDGLDKPLPELLLSVQCLSEIENINRISKKTGSKILLKVINCFFKGKEKSYLSKLIDAAKDIGTDWPGKEVFQFSSQYPNYWGWPEFLAVVFHYRHWIEKLCSIIDWYTCNQAVKTLSEHWPDDETYHFLVQCVEQYDIRKSSAQDIRSTALKELARNWIKNTELQYLIKNNAYVEGTAASLYGESHSSFGKIVFQEYIWSEDWYIDPRQSISANHIQNAAEEAGIPPDKIDEAVRSLSEYIGWDITKGSLAGKL